MEYEIRTADLWPDAEFELRAGKEGDGLTLSGYAAVFDSPSKLMKFPMVGGGRSFREIVHQGAFTRTLSTIPDVTLRYMHQLTQLPLARTTGGTMTLAEDDRGLRVEARLPDNEWGRPVRDAVERGDISGMSFRFQKVSERWAQDGSERIRHLDQVELGPEVSLASQFEAYPATSAQVRDLAESIEADPDELAEAFRALRDPDVTLTGEQRDLLLASVYSKVGEKFVDPKLAQMRERLVAVAS